MRLAIGFALDSCLSYSLPQFLYEKNCNAFFEAAGGVLSSKAKTYPRE